MRDRNSRESGVAEETPANQVGTARHGTVSDPEAPPCGLEPSAVAGATALAEAHEGVAGTATVASAGRRLARSLSDHALLAAIGCGFAYWLLRSVWGSSPSDEAPFLQSLLSPGAPELLIRFVTVAVFIVLGAFTRCVVSDLRTTEAALRQSETRLSTATAAASEWIWEFDPNGRYTFTSPFVQALLGYSPEEVLGKRMDELFHPDDRGELRKSAAGLIRRREPFREFMNRKVGSGGKTVWLSTNAVPIVDSDGTLAGYRGVDRDITDRIRSEERFKYISFHDGLTGLLNRACFEDEMARFNRELGAWTPFTVLLVDVDGLKVVNDTFGHKAGDELLREVAGVVSASFRHNDVVARIGGDEFCALLPGVELEIATSKNEEIRRRVKSYNNSRPAIPMSLSVGTATSLDVEGETVYDIYRRADDDMYEKKKKQKKSPRGKIVDLLLAVSSDRDFVSEGRVERITTTAKAFANALNLSEDTRRNLLLLVRVHDMGMVGVSDGILFKTAALTEEEYGVVKSHTHIGYHIASRSPELAPMADLIRHHHERWDGRGYPDGLAGEHIPLECRILSILDAYDAMTTPRPYSTRVTKEEAIGELRRCAATQFDPGLVEAFVAAIT